MLTTPTYGNCYFGLLYLLCRQKVRGLIGVSTNATLWPCHFVATNRCGIIHFRPVLPHEQNPHAPWWFLGAFEGICWGRARDQLSSSGRRVLWSTDCLPVSVVIVLGLLALLIVPFLVCWAAWPIVWCLSGARDALARSRRKGFA